METPPILSPNLEIDQNVVPYEDLKIQGSFGRKQTYPNDQVPTISTLLCLDTNDTPRIARSTPSGHIITHPDTSSGGGNGPVSIVPYDFSESTEGFGSSNLGYAGPIGSTIYGLVFSWTYDAGSLRSVNHNAYVRVVIETDNGDLSNFYLASIAISIPASGTTDRIAGEVHRWFDRGLQFHHATDDGSGLYSIMLEETNIGGGNMTLELYQDQ